MMERNILPLINRRAPLIERIRNRDSGANLEALGRDMAQVLTMEDSEKMETAESIADKLQTGLAKELGVEEDEIDSDFINAFAVDFVNIEPEDVLTEQSLVEHDLMDTEGVLEELEGEMDSEVTEEETSDEEEEEVEEDSAEGEEVEEEETGSGSPSFAS